MQNPKIKLFYILTVKTIKDIYVMNEEKNNGVSTAFCGDFILTVVHLCVWECKKKSVFLLSLNGMSGPMSGLWG